MTESTNEELKQAAQAVLRNNWVELDNSTGFSKPADHVYPYQWNWDSGFAAIGYRHFDIDRAQQELRSLFSGQWASGMLPHIIFHTESLDYFPDQSFWQADQRNKNAPKKPQTSGMTQPPVQAIAAWYIYQELHTTNQKQALEWLEEMYPKILKLHKYFYTARDKDKTGLVTIYHPWESGMDNSPRWDDPLKEIKVSKENGYKRQDTKFVDARFRPSDSSYDEYIFLAEKMKEADYDDEALESGHPFAVKDVFLSSILHLASSYLEEMAAVLGKQKDREEIQEWRRRFSAVGIKQVWSPEDRLYYDLDLRKGELVKTKTIACLAPIISGILEENQVEELFDALDTAGFCGEGVTCRTSLLPSVGKKEAGFNPDLYWRGPIWINTNWLIWLGLKNAGHSEHAQILRHNLLTLLREHGIWEYYSPEDFAGIGAERFSWSAALAIDILEST